MIILAFFNLSLYFSACDTGTTSSSLENNKYKFWVFFSSKDKSDFSVKPPTKSSQVHESSKGGHTKYVDRVLFGNLFSDKYLARKIPPKELPIKIALFLK